MPARRIRPVGTPLDCTLRAPPSKSVTHRALLVAAIARGRSRIERPLEAEDTLRTKEGLRSLGIPVGTDGNAWIVEGRGGRVPGGADLDLGGSGTSLRFLTALAALGERPSRLDGIRRLRERPISGLAEAIAALGGSVRFETPASTIPLVTGGKRPVGGTLALEGRQTSQFASALLLVAPALENGLGLSLASPVVSFPYVELTAGVLESFGVRISRPRDRTFFVPEGPPEGRSFPVEGDHSSASYFFAAAAIVGGRVRVDGLVPDSRQADASFARILVGLGCDVRHGEGFLEVVGGGTVPGFDLDAGETPDLVPTLAVIAAFAASPSVLRGVAHLRVKESDRLEVLAENLRRLGRAARATSDSLEIGPPGPPLENAEIRTAGDHRIAMAFAIAGLRMGVSIDDPECVAKSYPTFWKDFGAIASEPRTGS